MNRLKKLFTEKKENIVSIYFTAGYPKLNNTAEILKEIAYAGADIIEIGIPFSDPMADGPTIQKSSDQALSNGISLPLIFEQLEDIRKETDIPLIMMGYLNPVMQYGIENFCKKCNEVGIDGLILPDLPMREYEEEYLDVFKENGLENIFLITPQTSDDRIQKIDQLSDSFIYVVSSASITGAKNQIDPSQEAYFKRINDMKLNNPLLIGFGISNNQTYKIACNYSSGVIIGSAFIKMLSTAEGSFKTNIQNFISSIKGEN